MTRGGPENISLLPQSSGLTSKEIASKLRLPETLPERVSQYIPSKERLQQYPSPTADHLASKEILRPDLSGASFVSTHNSADQQIYIIPPWHPLNFSPIIPHHGGDYGSGVFEGGSLEPVVEAGEIVGANLILHSIRMRRFQWSMNNRSFDIPSLDRLDLAIRDLAAILAPNVLKTADGIPSRAYVRPSARPGSGALGIGLKPEHAIEHSAYITNWPSYFPDADRVYQGSGLVIAALPEQRSIPLTGKHASNYGEAGRVGNTARALGVDEALYFAPYLVSGDWENRNKGRYMNFQEPGIYEEQFAKVALADGPGEGIIAISNDGKLIVPPLDVNQLPSTTMMYITNFLAPSLGFNVEEKAFCLKDIQEENIVSMAYVGNAARIAPVGEIKVHQGADDQSCLQSLQLDVQPMKPLVRKYEQEVRGEIEPSDPCLLTPVEFETGKQAAAILEETFADWL